MKKNVLIMALNKIKPKQGVSENVREKEEIKERLIEVLKDELGVVSSKWGDGDMVDFKVSGKVRNKTPNSFNIEIVRAYVPKDEEKRTVSYPVPSPSA